MQASLPREKWRGFFLKIYFRRNCSRDNNFVPATIFSIFFKPLKNLSLIHISEPTRPY